MGQLSIEGLGPLPLTLLVPLWARAIETRRRQPILTDWSAVAAAGALNFDFKKLGLSRTTAAGACARTAIIDDFVRGCCDLDPRLSLVNIGEGLDNRFGRVDNGVLTCFDLDLPEVMRLRAHLYPAARRRRPISRSVLDFSWLDELDDGALTKLFVAEGVLMYLPLDRVKELLGAISARFPGAHMLFDSFSPWAARWGSGFELPRCLNARYEWSLSGAEDFENWAPGYRMLERRAILESHCRHFNPLVRGLAAVSTSVRWVHAVNWGRLDAPPNAYPACIK